MHHDDEELHVFPLLHAQRDPALCTQVHRMQADHVQMAKLWSALRIALRVVSEADDSPLNVVQLRPRAQRLVLAFQGLV